MAVKTIQDIDIADKRLLIRVDFNVPLENGVITDDARIVKSLPTIQYALKNKAKVILVTHLGRPKGEVNPEFSLLPVAKKLSEVLGQSVDLITEPIGPEVESKVAALAGGDIVLLENIRFYKEETANDPEFSKKLALLADVFVNDAFGSCHRAHASTAGVAEYLPAVAGLLMAKEIEYFDRVLESPDRPLVAIMGGAKIHDKIKVIESLLERIDTLIIGGGMAYTFAKADGKTVGTSKIDEEGLAMIPQIYEAAKKNSVTVVRSTDWIVGKDFDPNTETQVVDENIPDGWMGLDIGPRSIEAFKKELQDAKLVIWNGPLGVFEWKAFENGTKSVANAVVEMDATVIIGGGDSAAAVKKFGLEDRVAHVSTGGGASLEYLEGKVLPGIACLEGVKV
jgi:phosphoglycerate kinase